MNDQELPLPVGQQGEQLRRAKFRQNLKVILQVGSAILLLLTIVITLISAGISIYKAVSDEVDKIDNLDRAVTGLNRANNLLGQLNQPGARFAPLQFNITNGTTIEGDLRGRRRPGFIRRGN